MWDVYILFSFYAIVISGSFIFIQMEFLFFFLHLVYTFCLLCFSLTLSFFLCFSLFNCSLLFLSLYILLIVVWPFWGDNGIRIISLHMLIQLLVNLLSSLSCDIVLKPCVSGGLSSSMCTCCWLLCWGAFFLI